MISSALVASAFESVATIEKRGQVILASVCFCNIFQPSGGNSNPDSDICWMIWWVLQQTIIDVLPLPNAHEWESFSSFFLPTFCQRHFFFNAGEWERGKPETPVFSVYLLPPPSHWVLKLTSTFLFCLCNMQHSNVCGLIQRDVIWQVCRALFKLYDKPVYLRFIL